MEKLSERKQQYLAQVSLKDTRNLQSCFRMIAPYEEAIGKDFSQIEDQSAAKEIIEDISGLSLHRMAKIIGFLSRYCDWCIEQGITDHNIVQGIKAIDLDKTRVIRSRMFDSAEMLECFFHRNRPPIIMNSLAAVYASYYWLIFAGLTSWEAVTVKKSDFDFGTMKLHWNKQSYPIIPEAQYSFECAVKQWNVTVAHGEIKPLFASPYLLVNTKGVMTTHDLWMTDKRWSMQYKSRMLFWEDVFYSGAFLRCLAQEKRCYSVDFDSIARQLVKSSNEETIVRKQREIRHIYHQWKRAFQLDEK